MNHRAHTLIGAYVLDAVDDEERADFQRHIAECPECTDEATKLQATVTRLSDGTVTEPPTHMRNTVLQEIRRTRQEPPDEPPSATERAETVLQPRRIGAWRRVVVAAAAALALIAAAGGATYAIMQQQVDDVRANNDEVTKVMTAADAEVANEEVDGGRITVVSSATRDQAVVVVSQLADVSAQQAYQLWRVNDSGQTSAGVIPDGENSATVLVSDISGTDVIGVTEEPAGGSKSPTLPMVTAVEVPG